MFRYLQEVGYTDTILDVRTQRVRSLLGLSGSEQNGSVENKNLQHLVNGTERRKDGKRYARGGQRSHLPLGVTGHAAVTPPLAGLQESG